MEFRTLRSDEITLRVGNVGEGYYTLLLYKDARCDMNILDETVGAENWQRDHKEVKGNLYCGVGINKAIIEHNSDGSSYVVDRWIWKWDCGVESNTEKEKGEASDSFKRACVNWGIGRELYTAPNVYINCETIEEKDEKGKKKYKIKNYDDIKKSNSMKVKLIEYNNKREISRLVIVDSKGVQVFSRENIPQDNTQEIKESLDIIGGDYQMKAGKYKGFKISEIPDDYLDWYLNNGYDNYIKDNIKKYKNKEVDV